MSAVLALLVAACNPSEFVDPEVNLTVQVQADDSGDGSGVVTVQTPGLDGIFPWDCTVIDGLTAGDGLNEGRCSRDYTTSERTEVVFGAQGSGSRFVGWTGGHCSGTNASCSVTYAPSLSGAGHETIIAKVKFESTPETVELTIDGQTEAVSLFQGLTADAVATARKASGEVISGATYTWTSSAPEVASVSGAGSGTAIVRGESPGTASITVSSRGVTSEPVSVTVSSGQADPTFVHGKMLGGDGVTALPGITVQISRNSVGIGSQVTDAQGEFRIEVTPGGDLGLFASGVCDPAHDCNFERSFNSTEAETLTVPEGADVEFNAEAQRGYHLKITSGFQDREVSAGETFQVSLGHEVWTRWDLQGATPRITLGIDGVAGPSPVFLQPGRSPGQTGMTEMTLTAPSPTTTTEYHVYALLVTATATVSATDQYESLWPNGRLFIQVFKLTVTP